MNQSFIILRNRSNEIAAVNIGNINYIELNKKNKELQVQFSNFTHSMQHYFYNEENEEKVFNWLNQNSIKVKFDFFPINNISNIEFPLLDCDPDSILEIYILTKDGRYYTEEVNREEYHKVLNQVLEKFK